MFVLFPWELEEQTVIKSTIGTFWLRCRWRFLLLQLQRVQRGVYLDIRLYDVCIFEYLVFDYLSIVLVVVWPQHFHGYSRRLGSLGILQVLYKCCFGYEHSFSLQSVVWICARCHITIR